MTQHCISAPVKAPGMVNHWCDIMCCLPDDIFFKEGFAYFSKTKLNHIQTVWYHSPDQPPTKACDTFKLSEANMENFSILPCMFYMVWFFLVEFVSTLSCFYFLLNFLQVFILTAALHCFITPSELHPLGQLLSSRQEGQHRGHDTWHKEHRF